MTDLIGVASQTAPDDRIHVQSGDFVGILGDELAKLVPQGVVGLALLGHKVVIVDNLGQIFGGFIQFSNRL